MDLTKLPYIQAKNYHRGRVRPLRAIVIHDMEAPETEGRARWCANYFAGKDAPQASAHFCVDDKEVIQGVHLEDTAWAAPGLNADGINIENAGYAGQKRSDWIDAYSRQELALLAKLTAALCKKYSIPVRRLTVAQVKDGKSRGICGHVDVTNAFPDLGTGHTDPGQFFPWDVFLKMVQAEYDALNKKAWSKSAIAAVAVALGVPVLAFIGITTGPTPPAPKPTPKPTPTPAPSVPGCGTPTVKPTPQPTVKPTPKPVPTYYVVKKGDTLYSIAKKYKTTVAAIQKLNGLKSTTIAAGQKLRVK